MREKIIALIFCIIIIGISGSTLVKIFLTENEQKDERLAAVTEEQNTVIEAHEEEKKKWNEMNENSLKEDENIADETDKNTIEPKEDKDKKDNSFLAAINNFTQELSGKEESISAGVKIISKTTGNTYIESNTVLLGKDNWLFYKSKDDGNPILDYQGKNHYSADKMRSVKDKLEKETEILKNKGIELVFLMIPNKECVYSEFMPDNVKRKTDTTKTDKLAEYLQKKSKISLVYPKKELIEAKKIFPTYYKTDTHWTQIGAFIGIQKLKEAIDGNYDSFDTVKFKVKKKNYAGDLSKLCKMTDIYNDDIKYVLDHKSVNKKLKSKKRLLVIGDSFADLMPDICSQYFEEVKVVGVWGRKMEAINSFKPDVVVWECVERYIDRYDWISIEK